MCIFIMVALSLSVVLTGCGANNSESAVTTTGTQAVQAETTQQVTTEELKPVELSYYIIGSEQKDLPIVNDAINKIIKDKINATIKINLLDWGAYAQKMNVTIAAGEAFDLCWTASGLGFYDNVGKGAFIALDELLDKYAPKTKAGVPEKIWAAAKVNGKIYGIINWQPMATAYGFSVQKDLADKYNFDWKSVTKIEDLEPYLAAVKKNEPGKYGIMYSNVSDIFLTASPLYGMDSIGDNKMPGWVYLNDNNLKVVNQFDTPEFKNLIKTSRKWYQAGYFKKDAATTKDTNADRKAAKYAASTASFISFDSIDDPNGNGNFYGESGIKWYDKKLTKPVINTDRAAATLTAISKTSQNPERAMMFEELMNTDKELFNTMCYGIEGTHYTKVSDIRITKVKDSGYNPQTAWEFGNNENLLLDEGYSRDDIIKMWVDLNNTSDISPLLGFTFNSEPVKAQVAQCQSVVDEYVSGLTTGSIDPVKYLPEFLDKLKNAGCDQIIAEKQKQIDAWKASNSK
jgi:ABC-type sugar transport system, periplasmic component